MKKICLLYVFCMLTWYTHAQPQLNTSQYYINPYLVNPSYAGAESYTSAQLGYKRVWMGTANAPSNIYLTVHTRITPDRRVELKRETKESADFNKAKPANNSPIRCRSSKKYVEDRQRILDSLRVLDMLQELEFQKKYGQEKEKLKYKPYFGVGGMVYNERFGPFSRLGIGISGAIHQTLTPKARLSLGASLGVSQNSLNTSNIRFQDETDEVAQNVLNNNRVTNPELGLGAMLYTPTYYAGLSAFNLLPSAVLLERTFAPGYYATAGYFIKANKQLALVPSVLVRYIADVPMLYDISMRAHYTMIWGGVAYRSGSELLGAFVGININKNIDLTYSYDASILYSGTSFGTSEITIGYRLAKPDKPVTSRLLN